MGRKSFGTVTRAVRGGSRAGTTLLLVFTGLGLIISAANANSEYTPVYHPELTISRTSGKITIDGRIDDPGWRGAARAANFAEHNPGDQTRPEVDTEVFIAHDDDHLYVAWKCYDDPAQVRASFCERDRIFSDDYVILCLDTFGEATLAYEIAANPYGIPGDLLFSSSNGEDISYDMIFHSAGQITDDGWVVEMAIPFESMRFPDRDQQVWRVDFWRNRPRESRFQYSWAAYNRDEDCWPCQWGTVKGINGVKPGAGLELLPAVVAHQSGTMIDRHFTNDEVTGDVSLGIAYDISSELTAEATINPDFSQVESDAAQIDVNTTFALFYPERRPFFQEGSDLFDTYFNAVYTRSINDPVLAGKTTWRKGRTSAAFLSARDDHTVITLPFEEGSSFVENGQSYSNIVRARRDLGEQSHLGMVATDRRFDNGGSGSLAGVDGQIRLSKSNTARFQVLATYTDEITDPSYQDTTTFDSGKYTSALDGETYWGNAIYASLQRSTGNYWFGGDYWERSPTFRADNGFEPSNNVRQGGVWVGGIKRFENNRILENINADFNVGGEWNFDGTKKDEWLNLSYQFRFRAGQANMHNRVMVSNELFGGIQFDNIWLSHTCFSVQPSQVLSAGAYYDYGHRIARWHLVMGKEIVRGIWADVRPIDRFLVSSSLDYISSDDVDTGERLFSQSVFRSRMDYQVSREFSVRFVLQYNDRFESWDADPLLTYRVNSLSVFYIGSTTSFRELNSFDHNRAGWTLMDRQYFLKFQYLFQL